MARIRTIKPDLWLSPQVMSLSLAARILFIGLITQADDAGRGSADERRLKGTIFPGDEISIAEISSLLREIENAGLAVIYAPPGRMAVEGRAFMLPSWDVHQKIDRPRPSLIPPPQAIDAKEEPASSRTLDESSTNPRRTLDDRSRRIGREGKGREGNDARASDRERTPGSDPFDFAALRAAYPERAGRTDWLTAEHHARRLVDDGIVSRSDLLDGVKRYARFIVATGKSGTQYVLNPVRFFSDPDRPFLQPWTIPKPSDPRAAKQAAERAALEEKTAFAWSRVKARAAEIGCPLVPRPVDSPESFETLVDNWQSENGSRPAAVKSLVASLTKEKSA